MKTFIPPMITLLIILAMISCRSELTVDGQNVRDNTDFGNKPGDPIDDVIEDIDPIAPEATVTPEPEPAEIGQLVKTDKKQIHSRQSISLSIGNNFLAHGETLSLEHTDGDIVILEGLSAQESKIAPGYQYSYENKQGTLTLFPHDSGPFSKLKGGLNRLRLVVDDGSSVYFGETQFTVKNFPIFLMATNRFSLDVQTLAGFQGSVESLGGKLEAADKSKLLLGGFSLINQ